MCYLSGLQLTLEALLEGKASAAEIAELASGTAPKMISSAPVALKIPGDPASSGCSA